MSTSYHLLIERGLMNGASRISTIATLERLRQMLRREVRTHAGQRVVARDVGVHREVLRKFVEGQSTPTSQTIELMQDWAGDRPEYSVPLPLVALAILAEEVPAPARASFRKQIAQLLASRLQAANCDVPSWVHDELAPLNRPPAQPR